MIFFIVLKMINSNFTDSNLLYILVASQDHISIGLRCGPRSGHIKDPLGVLYVCAYSCQFTSF